MNRILITSALPFANGQVHIGQLAGCYLPADIYFKYQKLRKRDVIHICGADEHGVLISLKALREKTTPKEIVDRYYLDIKESLENFGIEYTNFSRTTRPLHYKTAQDFFLNLHKKGYLTPKTSEHLYCETCERWLPERFVEGICPYCDSPDARGDQCESCGRWLEPTMLKEPKCQMCGNAPIIRKTEHWCLRLDLLQPKLKKWIKAKKGWRENVTKFVDTWLREGLEPRPVTRDINWGVPVPLPDAKDKVIYVWFENLIGYISSTIEWNPEGWKDYWLNQNTELVHFIAKDNIVFHAIVWPSMLLAHGDFVMPTQIPANEFLNLEGRKLSTSRNRAVWLPEYLQEFEPDPLRYALTINAPEKGDVDFTWDDFLAKNNYELSDILGNFVNRTLLFITKHLDGKLPCPSAYTEEDKKLLEKIEHTRDSVSLTIERFEFKKSLKTIMALVKEGNRYFDHNKPWLKNERTDNIIYVCSTLIANLSILIQPFLPFTAKSIRDMLDVGTDYPFDWDSIGKFKLPKGMSIKKPKILFKKIEKSVIEIQKQKLVKATTSETTNEAEEIQKTQISFEDFEKSDIRVAEILSASKIKGAKKLLKLTISLGKETRQVIAGIAEGYSPEELVGKKVAALTNLEPRTIYGERSEAMLLAAVHNNKPILIIPDKDSAPGSSIS